MQCTLTLLALGLAAVSGQNAVDQFMAVEQAPAQRASEVAAATMDSARQFLGDAVAPVAAASAPVAQAVAQAVAQTTAQAAQRTMSEVEVFLSDGVQARRLAVADVQAVAAAQAYVDYGYYDNPNADSPATVAAQPKINMTVAFPGTFDAEMHAVGSPFAKEFEASAAAAAGVPSEYVNVTRVYSGSIVVEFFVYIPAENVTAAASLDAIATTISTNVQTAVEGGAIEAGGLTVDTTSFVAEEVEEGTGDVTDAPATDDATTTEEPSMSDKAKEKLDEAKAKAKEEPLLALLVLVILPLTAIWMYCNKKKYGKYFVNPCGDKEAGTAMDAQPQGGMYAQNQPGGAQAV